jgi:predicted MFS family arabinose efflux permease
MEQPARWSVVVGYAFVSSANQMLWLTFAPVTTVAAVHYGVSESAIGWLAEIFPLLYVVLALPAGALLDRWFRPGLLLGAWLTAAGALVRLGGSYEAVLLGQLLIAAAQPLVLNALTKVVSGYLDAPRRPAGIGVGSASVFAGMVLALVMGAVLDHAADMPLLVALGAGYAVVAALILSGVLRHAPAHVLALGVGGVSRLRTVWADPVIRTVTGLALLGFGVFVALTTWLQALLEPQGVSAAASGVLLLEMVVAGIVASAVLPPIVVRRGGTQGFLRGVVVVSAVGCIALAIAPRIGTAAVALLFVGAALITALPLLLEIVERRAGSSGATAAALLWMAGNLGGIVVALMVQGLLDHPALAFGLMGVLLLGGLALTGPRLSDASGAWAPEASDNVLRPEGRMAP